MGVAGLIVSVLAVAISITALILTFCFRRRLLTRIEPLEHLRRLPEISDMMRRESQERAEAQRQRKIEPLRDRRTQLQHIVGCLERQISSLSPDPPGGIHGKWLDFALEQEIRPTVERAREWLNPSDAELLRKLLETSPYSKGECRTPELRKKLLDIKERFETLAKQLDDEMRSLDQLKQ